MPESCSHQGAIRNVKPSAKGCEECLKASSAWVHLRLAGLAAMWAVAIPRPTSTPPSIFIAPSIPSWKVMIHPRAGAGVMSTR